MDFLVTRLGLRTALRFETRLAFLGLDALRAAFGALGFDARRALREAFLVAFRVAIFGALGFDARRALRAARRVVRLAARFGAFGVLALRAVRRATVLAAILCFRVTLKFF